MNRRGVVISILLAVAVLSVAAWKFAGYRAEQNRLACVARLRMLDEAKQKWGGNKRKGAVVDEQEINGLIGGFAADCPAGGLIAYGRMGHPPTCTRAGHAIPNWQDYTLKRETNSAQSAVPEVPRDPDPSAEVVTVQ